MFLRGKVATDAEKKAAEEIARGIEGVQAVRNELQVVPGSAKKVVEAKDDDHVVQPVRFHGPLNDAMSTLIGYNDNFFLFTIPVTRCRHARVP